MLYKLRRFHKPSISTENNVAQNALWLHSVFSNYGGKTKFQMLFKILAFLVHGNNRNESNTAGGRICFYLSAGCNFTTISCWYQRLQLFKNKNNQINLFTKAIPFSLYTNNITSDFDNRRARFRMTKLTD